MSPKRKRNKDLHLMIRLSTVAATTASFVLGSLLMVLVVSNLAYAQAPNNNRDDLTQAEVPALDFNNNDKSMLVFLKFTALNKAEFVATNVAYGSPHSNSGNPPVLRVQIYDYGGGIIQQFNYWHPLFALEFHEDGRDYLKILPSAVGRFVFPFDPNAALMKVSYLHHDGANSTWGEEVISVDLKGAIAEFCEQFPQDPDCKSSDLAVVDVSTAGGQQQLPIPIGNSLEVTVQTTVTNLGPDTPVDASLSRRAITPPGYDGVLVTPVTGEQPITNETTTIVTSLNERDRYDQAYTIECWKPGLYNILFESAVVSRSGAVTDTNKLNNQKQLNLEVDCRDNGESPSAQPLSVSIDANATDDGSPPTTIEFRAIAAGGIQPYKYRWNFNDQGSNSNEDVKGNELMTHQFTKLGRYNVTVRVTDSDNGYRGQTASDSIIVTISDKEPPQISVPSHIIVEATGPNGANATFTVSATDIVDGPVPVSCQAQSGGTYHSGTTTANFKLGTTPVNCEATDSSGNKASGSFPVTVQDKTPPTLKLPNFLLPVEATDPDGAKVEFFVEATDIVDGTATLGKDGTTITQDQVGGSISISCNPASGTTFGLGTTPVNCEATDSSGNKASGSFPVTVQDKTPPTLKLPNFLLPVEATDPDGAKVEFFVEATDIVDGTATLGKDGILRQGDNVRGSITISCNPASGYMFPLKITRPVNCEATDSSGNTGYGNFSVTVQDKTPPTLTVPPSITKSPDEIIVTSMPALFLNPPIVPVQANLASASDATPHIHFVQTPPSPSAIVKFFIAAKDIVDGTAGLTPELQPIQDQVGGDITISCDPASGSRFYVGASKEVICSAKDAAGNTGKASFPVTVNSPPQADTTSPVINIPSDITEEATGLNGATVSFEVSVQDDVDTSMDVSCDHNSGDTFPIGETVVTCTAEDSADNTAQESFTITVEEEGGGEEDDPPDDDPPDDDPPDDDPPADDPPDDDPPDDDPPDDDPPDDDPPDDDPPITEA